MQGIGIAKVQFRPDTRFGLILTAIYLAVSTCLVLVHEPWRDETQAWLIARAAASPLQLLSLSRYEGHPVLWHLCLWPLTRLGGPALMQGFAVLVGAAVVFVFACFAPFARSLKTLLAFGQIALFEWGVIARSYGLGVLLLFGATVLVVRRERHVVAASVLLALAAQTSVHAAIVAGGVLVLLVVERLSPWADPAHRAPPGPFAFAVALVALGLGASVLQVMPPPDSAVHTLWEVRGLGSRLLRTALSPVQGVATMPWGPALDAYRGMRTLQTVLAILVTLIALTTSCALLSRSRGVWLAAALPAFALEGLFFFRYFGGTRHAAFLLVAMLIALWLAPTFPTRERPASRLGALLAARCKEGLALALGFQVAMALVQARLDVPDVYSAARDTASLIRAAGLADRPLVLDPDFETNGVLAHIGRASAYHPNVAREGSYTIWDARHDARLPTATRARDEDVLSAAAERAGAMGSVVVTNHALDARLVQSAGARLVGVRRADYLREESFWVYEVPRFSSACGVPANAH